MAAAGALSGVATMPAGAASNHHLANKYQQANLISNRGGQGAPWNPNGLVGSIDAVP